MEAMAAACPVVTSALGALPETIQDGGICIEGQPGSEAYSSKIIEATKALLSNEDYYDKISKAARKRAEELSWQKVADRFEALF